jgi:hypothetical protein
LDEQTLLGAYRRLDGSVHQARVLIAFIELCRLRDEAPPVLPSEAGLLPVIFAQQTPDGRLQLVRQGLIAVGDAVQEINQSGRPDPMRPPLLKHLRYLAGRAGAEDRERAGWLLKNWAITCGSSPTWLEPGRPSSSRCALTRPS